MRNEPDMYTTKRSEAFKFESRDECFEICHKLEVEGYRYMVQSMYSEDFPSKICFLVGEEVWSGKKDGYKPTGYFLSSLS